MAGNNSSKSTFVEYSAFADTFELLHVCRLLQEQAEIIAFGALAHSDSCIPPLVQRLDRQCAAMREVINAEHPNLYRDTWIWRTLFSQLFAALDPENAAQIKERLLLIQLHLHEVLIGAHEVFDPVTRARLIAETLIRKQRENVSRRWGAKDYVDARNFCISEWKAKREAFNRNRSAFARSYVPLVKAKYEVEVTETTVKRYWLPKN